MTIFQFILLIGVALAVVQWRWSVKLDKELPAGDLLPWWDRYGPGMEKRQRVLRLPAALTIGVTIYLVIYFALTGPDRLEPADPRGWALGGILVLSPAYQWLQIKKLRRWACEGQSEVRRPRIFEAMWKPAYLACIICAFAVLGMVWVGR